MNERNDILNMLRDVFEKVNKSINTTEANKLINENTSNISIITEMVQEKISIICTAELRERFELSHYGANYIHPGFLVFWIRIQSDKERDRLRSDVQLMHRLRQTLIEAGYPEEGRNDVDINFESQETINREYGGNWYNYMK
jgi:hypothetical protein